MKIMFNEKGWANFYLQPECILKETEKSRKIMLPNKETDAEIMLYLPKKFTRITNDGLLSLGICKDWDYTIYYCYKSSVETHSRTGYELASYLYRVEVKTANYKPLKPYQASKR